MLRDRQSVNTRRRCADFVALPLLRSVLALFLLLCAPVLAAGCSSRPAATLTVYAASSLTEAFTHIGRVFEAEHAGVRVVFNFAGSQALSTQIEHGAAADLFAAADTVHVDRLQKLELLAEDPAIIARNRLIVALPQANPASLGSLRDLARPGLRIVIAQENVPVGRYTRQVLANLSSDAAYGSALRPSRARQRSVGGTQRAPGAGQGRAW